ncbi:Fe(3+) dicitrate ABC transporter permease subunit FecD [Photorhabdus akhurstii]|uniref:Fe(3+) dicitrate ABC transporter permease subunit FecD n=1 Tax=Photorhabdus akhurstii TaxID=171438 RepID=UPI000D4D2372|nr:Fe(3+) dicitrate ABC transporter permease subunit FecD [Photorhabdus akhurstii]MBS9428238.1 iron-dicitrate ABC transporter permease FecD [Photorhabdus akhurstii]PQQ42541.1 iron-dicitrate transporter subunit FecD [Photorhabdus luminescens]
MNRQVISLLVILLAVTLVLALRMGAQPLPWEALINGWQPSDKHHFVLTQYRLPRILLAITVGAALALSGVLVQGIVRNPLASPDVLGVNHAASLASVSALIFFPSLPVQWLPLLAFGGGIAALILLRAIAGPSSPLRLALVGVALSATWTSITDYLMLSRPQDINNALLWLTGSLWGRDWQFVATALPVLMILIPFSLRFCRDLDLLALGDDSASTLGVSLLHVQSWGLMLAVALAATGVAVCGPIGFISLVVPHLVRRLVGGRHRWLIPASMLMGAQVLLLADLLARSIAPPMELPAGVLTAIIGAPYFFWLLVRTR